MVGGGSQHGLQSLVSLMCKSVHAKACCFWKRNSLRLAVFLITRCSLARQQGACQARLEAARQGLGAVLAAGHQ